METHVSITFSNFTLSSNENTTPVQMELAYETKKIKFNYPLSEPLKINFSPKFIHDTVSLVLSTTLDSTHNKKNKVPFRGDVTLNKTIFLDNNSTTYEKNITMIPIEPIKEIKEMKDMKRIGKIFMQIQLLDSFEEWKKSFKNLNKKKTGTKLKNTSKSSENALGPKNASNSTSNINSKQKKGDENISEVVVDPLADDEAEDNKALDELNKVISLEHVNQLKEILKNDYKKLFPSDINSLKTLNENLYQKYNQLSAKYNEILQGLNNTNEDLRKKAVEYFNEYKDLKTKLEQKKNDLKKKQANIDNEISKNKQENEVVKNNLQKYYDEKDFFFKKLSSPKTEENANEPNKDNEQNLAVISPSINNNEIKMLRDALKKLSSLGYDLVDGLNITEEEKKILSVVLGENLENNVNENKNEAENNGEQEGEDNEADKEDYDLSNQIVGLIERDVNDLYMRKLIEQVKIDQIDAITYSFKGNTKTKDVEFKIENGNLVCNTGESFTVWLISNFSL
jgi:hypothetical protein